MKQKHPTLLKAKFKIEIIFLMQAIAPFEPQRYAGRNQRSYAETWFTVDSYSSIFYYSAAVEFSQDHKLNIVFTALSKSNLTSI